ncbi:MAG TPA: hypothetical protein VM941_04705 [Pyrinomonadaceae bacterium]|jgi:hypothetical protein|nr:hypothetical protein [Pyrinomonadaceae bacterium]
MTSLLLNAICVVVGLSSLPVQDARQTFWDQFKTAVTKRDVQTVARLSQFPIGMSYGIPAIKTKAQLTKRYRQLFNEQTDAAACFSKAKPEVDPANAKAFTVACPDAAGNEVVIYHFQQTKTGWKFTGLDNLNE